jgi:putative glycosyltransferase (TIGR04372 family)
MASAATLVVLIIRLLRPLVVIRVSAMHSSHIGAFAANTEIYLCEKDAGLHGKRIVDVFYHYYGHSGTSEVNQRACNQQLAKMWDRTLYINRFARWVDRVNHLLPGAESHKVSWRGHMGDMDIHYLLPKSQPHLSFTKDEERRAKDALLRLGVPEGAPFVCFHSRDQAYLDASFPQRDWSFQTYRNSSIQNYVPAAEELAHRGYYVLRMGAIVTELAESDNPMVIDYATQGRTDFLDIYLSGKCHFFLGSNSGLEGIPRIFRRPIVFANFESIAPDVLLTCSPGSLLIPKKFWLTEERRFSTFREILESGVSRILETQNFHQLGIELVENTPEEITDLALEMEDRLIGVWNETEEDRELQRRFWALFDADDFRGSTPTRIGAEFLRQNQELLA